MADVLPEYEGKAVQRAEENESRLKSSRAFSESEYRDFRRRLLDAYIGVMHHSYPAILIGRDDLSKFIDTGEYLSQLESGRTSGKLDLEGSREYSDHVYGRRLCPYERYGVAYLWAGRPPATLSRYGEFLLRLGDSSKRLCTSNAFDSNPQWPSYQRAFKSSDGCLYPVPYLADRPSDFVVCLMQYQEPAEVERRHLEDGGRRFIRDRNLETLQLLEGRHPTGYVECHVHSRVLASDVNVYSSPVW